MTPPTGRRLTAAALALLLGACAGPTDDQQEAMTATRAALDAVAPRVVALEGVVDADLGWESDPLFEAPDALRATLRVEPADDATLEGLLRETARLLWTSDVPRITTVRVTAEPVDGSATVFGGRADVWPAIAPQELLEQEFGPRPGG